MRRPWVWILVVLLVLGVAQFFRPERTNPPGGFEIQAPAEVGELLERSCYDCHSNRTEWPWYSNIVPVSWFVAGHVEKARADLDLTDWPMMDAEEQRFFLSNMKRKIKQEEMPLPTYLFVHRDARLSADDRAKIIQWIDSELAGLAQFSTQ